FHQQIRAIQGKFLQDLTDDNKATQTEYNKAGLVSTVKAPQTKDYRGPGRRDETKYVYDALGRRIRTIDPGNRTTTFAYDDDNRLTLTIDRDLRRREIDFDDLGRRIHEKWIAADGSADDELLFRY